MEIHRQKTILIAIPIVTIPVATILGAFLLFNRNKLDQYFVEILFLIAAWAICVYFTLRDYLTYYTVDSKSITRHWLGRTQTLRWDERRFIKRINVKYRGNAPIQAVIVCSRLALPLGENNRKLTTFPYHWSKKDTFLISNSSDAVYRELLKWCGGERDGTI